MLHDYGFYKFEKFENYMDNKEDGDTKEHLKPLFQSRDQFLRYDECSQMIGACFALLELRMKAKENEAKIASKICNKIFSYFDFCYLKEEQTLFLD